MSSSCEEAVSCLNPRQSSFLVGTISLILAIVDKCLTTPLCERPCSFRQELQLFKSCMITIFQLANVCLLLACALDNMFMLNIYLWFTLTFVLFGFVCLIMEFVTNFEREGFSQTISMVPHLGLLFALTQCLPLVENYRKCLGLHWQQRFL